MCGLANEWFKSYLSNRKQSVSMNVYDSTPGLAMKKKAGAWSPLAFFYPTRVVSFR